MCSSVLTGHRVLGGARVYRLEEVDWRLFTYATMEKQSPVLGENVPLQELWAPPTLLWASLCKQSQDSLVPWRFSGKVAKDLSLGPYEKGVDIVYVSPGKEFSQLRHPNPLSWTG